VPEEIERKFLVRADAWRAHVASRVHLRQFYLSTNGRSSIRVRLLGATGARLTIKSVEAGLRRSEFEYDIPLADAEAMLPLAIGSIIDKERHIVDSDGFRWEIDVFHGDNEGLVIAEIELTSTDQAFAHPDWLGAEVTGDRKYYNAALVHRPFKSW
jgi:adenylate cyclase